MTELRAGARRSRRRPAALSRIAVASLSATAMFTIVSLLAVRAEQGQVVTAPTPTAADLAAAALPPRQVTIYVTDPPPDAAAGAAPTASSDPAAAQAVDAGATPVAFESPGNQAVSGGDPGVGGTVTTPDPAATTPAPAPVPAPAPAPAPAPPLPSTGTGGS